MAEAFIKGLSVIAILVGLSLIMLGTFRAGVWVGQGGGSLPVILHDGP